jgi:hypothetical protein
VIALLALPALASAATVTFDGGGDGSSWQQPANWSTGTLPGTGDDVVIADHAVTSSAPVTVASISLDAAGGSLTSSADITTGMVDVEAGTNLDSGATLTTWNDSTIDGTMTVHGTWMLDSTLQQVNVYGSGALTIPSGATLRQSGPGTAYVGDNLSITLAGTITNDGPGEFAVQPLSLTASGGTVIAGTARVDFGANTVHVDGGGLTLDDSGGGAFNLIGDVNLDANTLTTLGTIEGGTVHAPGTVNGSLDEASVALGSDSLTVTGDLTNIDGVSATVDGDTAGAFGQLDVGGSISIDTSVQLNLAPTAAVAATIGTADLPLITYTGARTGSFAQTTTMPGFSGGGYYVATNDDANKRIVATMADQTPDPYSFDPGWGADPSTLASSTAITPTGFDAPAPISIVNGDYSLDGGAFTSSAGTINPGDTVTVRTTSSATFDTAHSALLDINGVDAAFTVYTRAATTPDPFSFTTQNDVATSTLVESETITPTGFTGLIHVGVVGGEYSINGGGYQTGTGQITAGDSVQLREQSAPARGASRTMTFTVNGTSATFTVTTSVGPDQFTFTDQTGVDPSSLNTSDTVAITGLTAPDPISVTGGEYSIDGGAFTTTAGTIAPGSSVTVRHTASSSYTTGVDTVLTIGTISDTFTSTTRAMNTTPDPFDIPDRSGVIEGAYAVSTARTISGTFDPDTPISITGGEYSINGGPYTSAAGTIDPGAQVKLRVMAPTSDATTVTATLTVGTASDTYSATTDDETPDAFSFPSQTGVAFGTAVTSASATITGFDAEAITATVTGGELSVNGGPFSTTPQPVAIGSTVTLRHTAAATPGTQVTTRVTIGHTSASFTSTTISQAPTVTFTQAPPAATASRTASAAFSSSPGATFACSLDGAAFTACSSPASYANLAQGAQHTLSVRASLAGLTGAAARTTWIVQAPPAMPTGLKLTFESGGKGLLSWKAPASTNLAPRTRFTLTYLGRTSTVTGTSKTVTGQTRGKIYSFTIKATGPAGSSRAAFK